MIEITRKIMVMTDRLLGRDELYNQRAVHQVADGFRKLPLPAKAILVGLMSRHDQRTRDSWIENLVRIAREYGEYSTWGRISLWFIDGPTRRLTNHRIDHALIDYSYKGGN